MSLCFLKFQGRVLPATIDEDDESLDILNDGPVSGDEDRQSSDEKENMIESIEQSPSSGGSSPALSRHQAAGRHQNGVASGSRPRQRHETIPSPMVKRALMTSFGGGGAAAGFVDDDEDLDILTCGDSAANGQASFSRKIGSPRQ